MAQLNPSLDRRIKAVAKMGYIPANTVVGNNTAASGDPAAIAVGASQIVARLASGNVKGASVAEILTLLGLPASVAAVKSGALVVDLTLGSVAHTKIALPACTVTGFRTVVEGTTNTADETVTPSNETGDMAGGAIVVANGSTDGTKDSSTPTTNNVFADGEVLTLTTDGGNGLAVNLRITILFTYT